MTPFAQRLVSVLQKKEAILTEEALRAESDRNQGKIEVNGLAVAQRNAPVFVSKCVPLLTCVSLETVQNGHSF